MPTLKDKLEALKQEESILVEKIKLEEERKNKLSQNDSIQKLEALLEPITEYIDKPRKCIGADRLIKIHCNKNNLTEMSIRGAVELYNDFYEQNELDNDFNWGDFGRNLDSEMEGVIYEEIFTTMMGIIKKQNTEIEKLNNRMNIIETLYIQSSTN